MDLKDDIEKNYLDAPPSQTILPLSSLDYDEDDEDDDGAPLGIRGFEGSDSGEEDGETKLSLWPRHHNDPQPNPHPLDKSGVFCREWGKPTTIMKEGFGALWTAPLIPQNLLGRSIEAIITNLEPGPPEADPTVLTDVTRDFSRGIRLGEFDWEAQITDSSENNSPRSSEASITSTLAESPSETLVESPSEELSRRAIPRTSLNPDLFISQSPIPHSVSTRSPLPASFPPVVCNHPLAPVVHIEPEAAGLGSSKRNQIISLSEEESKQQHINAKESRAFGSGKICTVTSDTTEKYVACRIKRAPGPRFPKPFPCPAEWCSSSFTRANDAERHFKNAAIHRGAGNSDSSTCCRMCGEELSRIDARNRHERNKACGKRRMVRKCHERHASTPA